MRPSGNSGLALGKYSPRPYPDECVGSLLIRACRHVGLTLPEYNRYVLGSMKCRASFVMSAQLGRLAELTGLPAESLLKENTVFPYLTAFLPGWQVRHIRGRLLSEDVFNLKSLATLIQHAAVSGLGRRFCPECARQELASLGESYWHRLHQLPGVLVCIVHHCRLRQAESPSRQRLELPHETSGLVFARFTPGERLASIVMETEAVLCGQIERLDATYYRAMAIQAGYSLSSRELATASLSRDLVSFYGREFMEACGFPVSENSDNAWPALMIRPSVTGPFPSAKHVLLRVFLRYAINNPVRLDKRNCPGRRLDFGDDDVKLAKRVSAAIAQVLEKQEMLSAGALLRQLGAWIYFREHRDVLPLTSNAIKQFRLSPYCRWRIRNE